MLRSPKGQKTVVVTLNQRNENKADNSSLPRFENQGTLQRVTSEQIHLLSGFTAKDDDTITFKTGNALTAYDRCFGFSAGAFEQYLRDLAQNRGRKLRILDAGCGDGAAIASLLSLPQSSEFIESCTGVSLHYYSGIRNVFIRHGSRFTYYKGDIIDALSLMQNQFDVIFDMYGAYPHCIDKVAIMKGYHQALRNGGSAFINKTDGSVELKNSSGANSCFIAYLAQLYPQHFKIYQVIDNAETYTEYYSHLQIFKTEQPFPDFEYQCLSYREEPSILVSGNMSLETLRQGQATWPQHVVVELKEKGPKVEPSPSTEKEEEINSQEKRVKFS